MLDDTRRLAHATFPDHKGEFSRKSLRSFAIMVKRMELDDIQRKILLYRFGFGARRKKWSPLSMEKIALKLRGDGYVEITSSGVSFLLRKTIEQVLFYSGNNLEMLRVYRRVRKKEAAELLSEVEIRIDIKNKLGQKGISTIGQLIRVTEQALKEVGITEMSGLNELKQMLEERDLCLDMGNIRK